MTSDREMAKIKVVDIKKLQLFTTLSFEIIYCFKILLEI